MAGVTVGRVDAMRVDPADYSAIATLRILSGLRLPTDSMASIKTTGLIGDKYVFLSPGADDTFLEPGTRITMTESSVDLESLLGKMAFGSADKETEESTPTVNLAYRLLLAAFLVVPATRRLALDFRSREAPASRDQRCRRRRRSLAQQQRIGGEFATGFGKVHQL